MDFLITTCIAIIAGYGIRLFIKKLRPESDDETVEDTTEPETAEQPSELATTQLPAQASVNEYEGMDVPTLMRTILRQMNCQYQEDEKGGIQFNYQNENFLMLIDSCWVRVYDLQWWDCPLDDLDAVTCMRKSINEVNARQACTAIFYFDNEARRMRVYSQCNFIIRADFPHPLDYFAAWLDCLFKLKQALVIEFNKEMQENSRIKNTVQNQ